MEDAHMFVSENHMCMTDSPMLSDQASIPRKISLYHYQGIINAS